jgi:hypothetical protein
MRIFLSLCFCLSVFTLFGQGAEFRITAGLVGANLFPSTSSAVFREGGIITSNLSIEQSFTISPYLGIEKLHENGWRQSWGVLRASFNNSGIYIARSDASTGIFEPTSGEVRKVINLDLRWALGKTITQLSGQRFFTSFSLTADPFLLYYRSLPNTSAAFPFTFSQLGVAGNLLPQFEYKITPRLSAVMQTAITVGRLYWQRVYVETPVFTESQRNNNLIEGDFKLRPNQLLLGVSYKL